MRATIRLVSVALAVTVVTVMAGPALEAKTVTARVIGDGRGVEGATVRLFFDTTASPWRSGSESEELEFAVESIADTDGAVELTYDDRLSPESRYRIHLEVEATGWATLRLPVRDGSWVGTWELPEILSLGALPLRRGHRLEGRVVSASGSPVPGATLIAVAEEDEDEEEDEIDWLTTSHRSGTVSDAEGRFALPLLEAGSYRVVVDAADHEIAIQTVEVAPGARPIVLPLVEALPLTGRVLDSAGRGLSGVDVTLRSDDGDIRSLVGDLDTVTSDGDGRFRFDRGPSEPGSVSLSVSRPACRLERWSWETHRQRGGLRLDEPIRCLPPTELVVAVHESAGPSIEGAEVTVSRVYDRPVWAGPVGTSLTELDGTATFHNLAPGRVSVFVERPGYESRTVRGRVSRTPGHPLTLEVELEAHETRELELRVADHQGHPVASALLQVSDADTFLASQECFLDEDGRCTIDRWPVVPHDIELELKLDSAEHEGPGWYTARLPALGEPLLVTLPPPSRARVTVSGRIVDRHGQPVRGARLALWDVEDAPRFVDENGAFELYRVTEGEHDIGVSAPGFARHHDEIEVRHDTTEITVVLVPSVRIRGRLSVRDAAAGTAPPDLTSRSMRVWAERDGGGVLLGGALSGDSYTIDGAGAGPWRLRAEAGGRGVGEPVEIPEGVSEVVVDLELPPAHRLSGTVTIDGEPLRSRRVSFMSGVPEEPLFLDVDLENGRFETRLQSGRWELSLFDDRGSHEREIDVRGDLDLEIELQMAPIGGRVVDSATGAAIEGITVRAMPVPSRSHGPQWKTTTDVDGRFDFGRVLTGSWAILLHPPNRNLIRQMIEVDAGGANIEIVLPSTSELADR